MTTISDTIRSEFEQEMPLTRRVIERVPSDRAEWKPHPKSFPLAHLAQLIAGMPGWMTNMAASSKLDLRAYPGYSMETTETLLNTFDNHVRDARAALANIDDAQLDDTWSLMFGDRVVAASERGASLRETLRHLAHHRGQMTVYLRMLDVPVPSIYGPSADDRGNFNF
jgi:uncharacterized damage-inducible protein DinB